MKLSKGEHEWLRKAAIGSGKKIEQSNIFLSLMTKNYKEDPLCALQIGIAVLLGKPICVVALDGIPVPEGLKKLSFHTEELAGGSVEEMQEAVKRALKVAGKVLPNEGEVQ